MTLGWSECGFHAWGCIAQGDLPLPEDLLQSFSLHHMKWDDRQIFLRNVADDSTHSSSPVQFHARLWLGETEAWFVPLTIKPPSEEELLLKSGDFFTFMLIHLNWATLWKTFSSHILKMELFQTPLCVYIYALEPVFRTDLGGDGWVNGCCI